MQQFVSIEMKISDQRHGVTFGAKPLADFIYCRGCGVVIHRNSDQFRPSIGQLFDLGDGGSNIGRIGVGHGLYDHRLAAADHELPHSYH